MYRRERSGPFIVLTTFLIVVAMAVFTYIMWGMARRIDTITLTMLEVNDSFKEMVVDMHSISQNMSAITATMASMNTTIGTMDNDMTRMSASMEQMTGTMQAMNVSMNRMTMDVGRASYAFSNPMSYMFGNGFPF